MKKRVVLCTDSVLTYETLRAPLLSAGWQVMPAATSREALEHCAGAHPHLLLVDLDWPLDGGGDGSEVARGALNISPHLPIIVISGREDLGTAVESLGVAVVVGKPIDVPALLRTAEELMAPRSRARRRDPDNRGVGFRRLAPNPEAFREALWQRVSAPFYVANQPRHFGLNE